jgi:hypothetical protein
VKKKKGKRYVFRNGKFVEGKAKPKLLDPFMRQLPSEYVTNEVGDRERIHELDPDHVREAILDDIQREEAGENDPDPNIIDEIRKLTDCPVGQIVPLNKWRVDGVRARMVVQAIDRAVIMMQRGQEIDLDPFYVWFPVDNANIYAKKPGNPPPDSERPDHLKGYDLWVDPLNWPARIMNMLRSAGIPMPDLRQERAKYQEYRKSYFEKRNQDRENKLIN